MCGLLLFIQRCNRQMCPYIAVTWPGFFSISTHVSTELCSLSQACHRLVTQCGDYVLCLRLAQACETHKRGEQVWKQRVQDLSRGYPWM